MATNPIDPNEADTSIPGMTYRTSGELSVQTKMFRLATKSIAMGRPSSDGKAVNIVDARDVKIRRTVTFDGSLNQGNVNQVSRSGSKKVPIARDLKLNPITRDKDQNYLAHDPVTGEMWELTTFRQPVQLFGMTIGSYKATKGAYWSQKKTWAEQRLAWKQQSSNIAGLPMIPHLFDGRLGRVLPIGIALPPECFLNADYAMKLPAEDRSFYQSRCVANYATYSDGFLTDPRGPLARMGELLMLGDERAYELLKDDTIGEATKDLILEIAFGAGLVPIMSGKAGIVRDSAEWQQSMKLVVRAGALDDIPKEEWVGIEKIRCEDLVVRAVMM